MVSFCDGMVFFLNLPVAALLDTPVRPAPHGGRTHRDHVLPALPGAGLPAPHRCRVAEALAGKGGAARRTPRIARQLPRCTASAALLARQWSLPAYSPRLARMGGRRRTITLHRLTLPGAAAEHVVARYDQRCQLGRGPTGRRVSGGEERAGQMIRWKH